MLEKWLNLNLEYEKSSFFEDLSIFLGHMLPSLSHSNSWPPQFLNALWILADRLQVQAAPTHGLCMYSSASVHCLGKSVKTQMLICFKCLIYVLSRVPGEMRLNSNRMLTEKPGKGECSFVNVFRLFTACLLGHFKSLGKLEHRSSV